MASQKNLKETETALTKARTFIQSKRRSDGLWSDFLTLAGESIHWVSGYVGYALISSANSFAQNTELDGIALKILQQQNPDGGWGYGPGVPSDADSTSWCLRFLSKLKAQDSKSKENALAFLLKHQSKLDGGFRTYANPKEIARFMRIGEDISFVGWSSSQMCVTAVACQALMENGSRVGVEEALGFIRKGQTEEGFWNPYWWSGKLYATLHCMQALKQKGDAKDEQSLSKAQHWITSTQLTDGGWSDALNQEQSWPFSTALAIKALLLTLNPKYMEKIADGVRWLIQSQLSDGSWSPNHILRIPYPFMKDPWMQEEWRTDGKAINAAIKDHNRLYTTATALSALAESKKYMRGNQ